MGRPPNRRRRAEMEPRRVKNQAQIALGTPKSPQDNNFEFFEHYWKMLESFTDLWLNLGSLLEVIFEKQI